MYCAAFSTAVVIKCDEYKVDVWWHANKTLECNTYVLNVLTEDDRYVTTIEPILYPKNKVEAFCCYEGIINYFPRHIEKFFTNLIGLSLMHANISEVHSEDLKPFPELIRLNLIGNRIEILESDLFIHNPKMTRIGFNDNRIYHVDSNVFTHLDFLVSVHFKGNKCYSDENENDRIKALYMIFMIKTECFDMEYALAKMSKK